MLRSYAWAYGAQFIQHDFVCGEIYSICCQGDQQVENYNNVIYEYERNSEFVGSISGEEGADYAQSA